MKTFFSKALLAVLTCTLATSVSLAQNSNQNSTVDRETQANLLIQDWSKTLDLSDDQKKQIRNIVEKHNEMLRSTWEQFTNVHAKAIQMEATMYAAMEDHMNSQQKEEFRRSRNANATTSKKSSSHASHAVNRTNSDGKNASTRNNSNQGSDGQTHTSGSQQKDSNDESAEVFVTTMVIIPVETAVEQSGLDENQKSQCNETCRKFHTKLNDVWSEIHKLHYQMVKTEAEKLDALQGVLEKDQIQKLKKSREDWNEESSSNG